MKLFKKSIWAVAALTALAFTACSDDDQYNPGNPSTGVYFNAADGEFEVSVSANENEFNVPVYRQGLTDAATYHFTTATPDEGLFTVSDEVTFEEGANQANIVVTYDPTLMTLGKKYTLEFTFDEGVPVCAYGSSTVTAIVSLAASFSDWEPFGEGTGTYEYVFLWEGITPNRPISYRYQIDEPAIWDVKIEEWGPKKVDFIFYYAPSTNRCLVEMTNTGDVYDGYGPIYVMDYGEFLSAIGREEQANEYRGKSHYDPEKGLFMLCVTYFMLGEDGMVTYFTDGAGGIAYDYEYFQMDGFGDYTANISYAGSMINATGDAAYAFIDYMTGADIEKLVMLMGPAQSTTAQDLLDDIIAGSPDCVEVTGKGTATFQLDGAGTYNVVGVTYADGEPYAYYPVTFDVNNEIPENLNLHWPIVGKAQFIDGWLTPLVHAGELNGDDQLTTEAYSWRVDVRESANTPGLYRLVSPWTNADCPILNYNTNKASTDFFIDATNPDCVKILSQYSGFTNGGYQYYVSNYAGTTAGVNMTDSQLEESPYNSTLEDDVITVTPSYWSFVPSITPDDYMGENGIAVPYTSLIMLDLNASAQAKARKARATQMGLRYNTLSNDVLTIDKRKKASIR